MAEGLSAVAAKASPRAVASASWSARRKPRANMEGEVMVRRRVAIDFDKLMMGNGLKEILEVLWRGFN